MTNKITCPCGSIVNHNYFRIHIYSNKHLSFINNNTIKDYAEIYNEDLYDEINYLYENKTQFKENYYLQECNRILNEFKNNNGYKYLIDNLINNHRFYNKIISEIVYKKNKILNYQYHNNIYYNYYLIDNELIIVKIDYIKYL